MRASSASRGPGKAFGAAMLLLTALLLFLAGILQDHPWVFAALLLFFVLALLLRHSDALRGRKRLLVLPIFLVLGFLCLSLGRPDRSISFQGNLLNNAIRFKTLVIEHKSPEEAAASLTYTPYVFGSWKAPKGYISPVFADYQGMPPLLIQVGTTEMLLSDSRTVAKRAQEAGCAVRLIEYKGMWHTFYTAMTQFREQKEAWAATEDFIHTLR